MKTLKQARDDFFQDLEAGNRIDCPCCTRTAAYVTRNLDSGLCRTLIHIYRHNKAGREWVNTSRELSHGMSSTAALLRHWGLAISKEPVSKARGADSGYWKITDLGTAFVEKRATVPGKILTWKGELIREPHGPHTSIISALGKKFTLEGVMEEDLQND